MVEMASNTNTAGQIDFIEFSIQKGSSFSLLISNSSPKSPPERKLSMLPRRFESTFEFNTLDMIKSLQGIIDVPSYYGIGTVGVVIACQRNG